MKEYRKRRNIVEAIQFRISNYHEVKDFTKSAIHSLNLNKGCCKLTICNREEERVEENDYIVKEHPGVFRVYSPRIFKKIYQLEK